MGVGGAKMKVPLAVDRRVASIVHTVKKAPGGDQLWEDQQKARR